MRQQVVLPLLVVALTAFGGPALRSESSADKSVPMMGADCRGTMAAVQPLAKVTNTYDHNYQCLGVRVDAGANVMAFRFETHRPDGNGTNREFSLDEVASERGAVLDGRPGHDAVILRGRIAAHVTSAPLTVEFLRNGVTGEYRRCGVTLKRDDTNGWHLLDAQGRRESQIVVETWGLPLVGTIGIDNLRGICPTAQKS